MVFYGIAGNCIITVASYFLFINIKLRLAQIKYE